MSEAREQLSLARVKLTATTVACSVAETLLPNAQSSLELCDHDRDVRGGYDTGTDAVKVHVGICSGKEHGFDNNRLHLRFETSSGESPLADQATVLVEAVKEWLAAWEGQAL
jgi:hypothetical protein